MPRLFRSLSLLALLSLGASFARAADVDYFLPVTYDMVISRSVTKTDSATKLQTNLAYEIFTTRDLLREVLKSHGVTNLANWSLVAKGNSSAFSADPRVTDTISSLQFVARNSKTKEIKTIPTELAIGFTQIFSACAYSRNERHEAEATQDPDTSTLVSSSTSLSRLAELTQNLKARGSYPAGTLMVTGGLDYTNTYGKVNVGKESTGNAVLRPTRATFRASGTYNDLVDGADGGVAEIVITLGAPTYVISTPD